MRAVIWASVFAAVGTLWGWWLRGEHERRRGLGPVRVTWFYADTLCCRKCGELSTNAGVWGECPACGFAGELTS